MQNYVKSTSNLMYDINLYKIIKFLPTLFNFFMKFKDEQKLYNTDSRFLWKNERVKHELI